VELLREFNSVILKENSSGNTYYFSGCKSRNFYHVIVVVVVVVVVVVIVYSVLQKITEKSYVKINLIIFRKPQFLCCIINKH
jgi:hypothetical protein